MILNKLLQTILLSSLVVFALSSCSSGGFSNRMSELDSALIVEIFLSDMPLPPGSRIRDGESVILGGGAGWAGRLGLDCSQTPAEALVWFRDVAPQSGWDLISSTIGNTIVMVFQNEDRVATIEIFDKGFGGNSDVIISVVMSANVPQAAEVALSRVDLTQVSARLERLETEDKRRARDLNSAIAELAAQSINLEELLVQSGRIQQSVADLPSLAD